MQFMATYCFTIDYNSGVRPTRFALFAVLLCQAVAADKNVVLIRAGRLIDVRAGKTGFISKSGYCLATLLRLPQSEQQVAVVVLGARSNAGRFMETQNLFTWLSTKAATLFATRTPALQPQ